MKITVMTSDEQFISLDVNSDESVENVKALLEIEQQLQFNGNEIRNSDLLSVVGVKDGDLITMLLASDRLSEDQLRIAPDAWVSCKPSSIPTTHTP